MADKHILFTGYVIMILVFNSNVLYRSDATTTSKWKSSQRPFEYKNHSLFSNEYLSGFSFQSQIIRARVNWVPEPHAECFSFSAADWFAARSVITKVCVCARVCEGVYSIVYKCIIASVHAEIYVCMCVCVCLWLCVGVLVCDCGKQKAM